MLEHVDTGERSRGSYRGVFPDSTLDELIHCTCALRGARVLHGLGQRGRERLREHVLLPPLLLNEVSLLEARAADRPIGARDPTRDSVCGIAVAEPGIATRFEGREYVFCSEGCRARFYETLRRYAGTDDT